MNLRRAAHRSPTQSAFTLAEVVIALGVFTILIHGLIYGYVASARRAEWSAHSLAAQSLASQGVEQARAAKWDPQAWPIVDELPPTNFVQIDTLDIPVSSTPYFATNYIRIRNVSANPPLREIQTDCVWKFVNQRLYTNTVTTLRAPDQ